MNTTTPNLVADSSTTAAAAGEAIIEIPGLDTALRVEPTPAMRRGDQSVFQCAWCGCVVVQPQPAEHRLGDCPSCSSSSDWWRQSLPTAGLHPTGHQPNEASGTYSLTVAGVLAALPRRDGCRHFLCNGHVRCILAPQENGATP